MDEATAGYEQFEMEADVGIHGWGPTRAEAFAQTALGVFALVAEPAGVEARDVREVRAQAETPETLLVNWINECLYVHEIEGYLAARIEVPVLEGGRVHALLHGEEIDPSRHVLGTVVKAATLHKVEVSVRDGRHHARVVLDV